MALQRSGRYMFWGLSWADVVEKLPSGQDQLEPNGLALGVHPTFTTKPELYLHWWPKPLLQQLKLPDCFPFDSARQAQTASSLQLLMAYLLNPSERWWQGLAHQFVQAQLARTPLHAPELSTAIEALQLRAHVDEWQQSAAGQAMGQRLPIAPGLEALNLADLDLHQQHHPAASFRAIHFQPEPAATDQQQQAAWREWLRQANLFQFPAPSAALHPRLGRCRAGSRHRPLSGVGGRRPTRSVSRRNPGCSRRGRLEGARAAGDPQRADRAPSPTPVGLQVRRIRAAHPTANGGL